MARLPRLRWFAIIEPKVREERLSVTGCGRFWPGNILEQRSVINISKIYKFNTVIEGSDSRDRCKVTKILQYQTIDAESRNLGADTDKDLLYNQ